MTRTRNKIKKILRNYEPNLRFFGKPAERQYLELRKELIKELATPIASERKDAVGGFILWELRDPRYAEGYLKSKEQE
jgi:hypothetical protein